MKYISTGLSITIGQLIIKQAKVIKLLRQLLKRIIMERRVPQTNFKVYYETNTNKTKWRTHRSMNQVSPKFKPGKEVVNRLDKSTNAKKGWPCQQPLF